MGRPVRRDTVSVPAVHMAACVRGNYEMTERVRQPGRERYRSPQSGERLTYGTTMHASLDSRHYFIRVINLLHGTQHCVMAAAELCSRSSFSDGTFRCIYWLAVVE